MPDEATVNDQAAGTPIASPSDQGQSAADVSNTADQSAGTQESDVFNPSLEADPWADLGKETTDETVKTDDKAADKKADEPDKKDEAAATEKKPADEPKKETEAEKSLEDQVLEEAFGDKKPDDDTKKPDEPAKEEDLDKLDPKEMIERQRNAQAKSWAERNAKRAEIVKDFQYSDKPITEIATKFKELNEGRYTEFAQHAAHELVDANPDATFQRAYVVSMMKRNPYFDPKTAVIPTLEQVIAGNFGQQNGNGTNAAPDASAGTQPNLVELTKELDATLGFDWRNPANDHETYDERELMMVKTLRTLESQAKADAAKLVQQQQQQPTEKAKELEKPQGVSDEKKAEISGELNKTVIDYRTQIEAKVLPWIAKNTGLEISKDDTPEITAFKENLMLHYKGTDYQRANNIPSDFETYATTESTVAPQLEEVWTRIIDVQLKETLARMEGKTADAQKFHAEAEAERVSVITLLAQANKEFKTKRIDPHLTLLGTLSTSLTQKSHEASQRIEVVSNGGDVSRSPAPAKNHATADDIWNSMTEEAAEEDRLRQAA